LRAATIDFGDGTTQSLGNLAGGNITVTHTYSGPSDSSPRNYTATVIATDINGETATSSIPVVITPRNTTPIAVTLTATAGTRTQLTERWTFTAEATGGGEGGTGNASITSYEWDFGDGSTSTTTGRSTSHVYERNLADPQTQRRTVTVTARTGDGRSGTAREEIIVQYNAGPP
jgi:PKD repeat protein